MATRAAKTTKTDEMWIYYALALDVRRLVGGIPKHPEIIKRWQEAHLTGKEGEPTSESATDATVELLGQQALDPEEVISGIWTGFVTDDDDHLAIEARLIKAMFKESANIIRVLPGAQQRNTKGDNKVIPLRARVAERVFVEPHVITLLKDDKPVTDPESAERPIHVMTAQGPRTALKRTDYVEGVRLNCTLRVLNDGLISEKILRMILDHAQHNGLGTDRSQGNGTFVYELTPIEK